MTRRSASPAPRDPCSLLPWNAERPRGPAVLRRRALRAAQSVDLVVAATTDVHGRVRGWDYYADTAETSRGLARAATIVDSVREANPGRVLLVDAGDFLQGNPFTYAAARASTRRCRMRRSPR